MKGSDDGFSNLRIHLKWMCILSFDSLVSYSRDMLSLNQIVFSEVHCILPIVHLIVRQVLGEPLSMITRDILISILV